ncbi:MAG: DUF3267 domain-containing protein [Erysipelotrichaceae bacterium]|nr:DUF3267 domain-containing protein [Erysipelotrichaceae bacterium]
MKLQYKKEFNGDLDSLPKHPHEPGAVKFKEIDDFNKLSLYMNILAFVILVVLFIIDIALCKNFELTSIPSLIGFVLSFVVLLPHEFLHAICFKEDVELYTAFDKGMLFVTGTETFSKSRFVFMSLLPNIVFGFIPWIFGLLFQDWMIAPTLISLGTLAIAQGVGDYYNVFNAITQMPKGARCYLYGMNTYWYMPISNHSNLN